MENAIPTSHPKSEIGKGFAGINDESAMRSALLDVPCPYREWPQELDRLLLEATDTARQQLHAVQVEGTFERRQAAELKLDELKAAWTGFRLTTATAFLFGLRATLEQSPEVLTDMLLGLLAEPIAEAIESSHRMYQDE